MNDKVEYTIVYDIRALPYNISATELAELHRLGFLFYDSSKGETPLVINASELSVIDVAGLTEEQWEALKSQAIQADKLSQ